MAGPSMTSHELELVLTRFRSFAEAAHVLVSPLPEPTLPDCVLGEDSDKQLEDIIQAIIDAGATTAWATEARFDDSVEDDRLEDFLERHRVARGSLLGFAVYWPVEESVCAWELATAAYTDAMEMLTNDPDGVIHVDEDFMARMHAREEARARESRKRYRRALEHSAYFEDLILSDHTFRALPRRERGSRAREILRQIPAEGDMRRAKFLALDRAIQRADTAVQHEAAAVQLCIAELGTELAKWPVWAPGASRDEQRDQASTYLVENVTQGWCMPKALLDKLVTSARRVPRPAEARDAGPYRTSRADRRLDSKT